MSIFKADLRDFLSSFGSFTDSSILIIFFDRLTYTCSVNERNLLVRVLRHRLMIRLELTIGLRGVLGTGEYFSFPKNLHDLFHVGDCVDQVSASVEGNAEGLEWVGVRLIVHLIGDLNNKNL